jgi:hypothetical protein
MAYNTFNPIVYKGLVLYLDAENLKSYSGSGLNWYDLTSNGNNGVLTNGATFSLSGNSIQFDGVDDYVIVPYNSSFNLTQDFTISVWVKTSSYSNNYQGIFNLFDNIPIEYNGFGIVINDQYQKYAFLIAGSAGSFEYIYMDNNFVLEQWYLITGVNLGGVSSLYVNGVKQLDTSTLTIVAPLNNLRIGTFYETGSFGLFNGNVSQCLLYNRSLTPAEILQNYNATKWRFINELPSIVTDQLILNLDAGDPSSYPGSGTTWYDLTVNNNDGVLTNGVTYDSVVGDGSMIFDGVNDYVNLGTSVGKLVQFTISVWLKPDNWNNCGIVFSSNTGGGQGSTHWGLWGRVSGNMEIYVSNGSSYQSANTSLPWSSSDIPNSSFTNIVITVDGSNIRIFKNSIQIGSDIAQTISQSGTAYDLCVGKNPADSGYFYDGYISDVLVYSKALTPSEVLQNFNVQKNRYGL